MGRKGSRSSNIVNSTPKECAGTDTTTKRSKAAEVAPDPGPSEEQITQSSRSKPKKRLSKNSVVESVPREQNETEVISTAATGGCLSTDLTLQAEGKASNVHKPLRRSKRNLESTKAQPAEIHSSVAGSRVQTGGKQKKQGKQQKSKPNKRKGNKKSSLEQQENIEELVDLRSQSKDHELNEEVYEQCVSTVEINLEDDDHVPASGVSVEAAHSTAGHAAPSIPSPSSYTCEFCSKVLKTKHGFQKHVMAHRIKDANKRKPSAETLQPLMESFTLDSLKEIIKEHGEEKRIFVQKILDVAESGPDTWTNFLSDVTEPILNNISKPTKLLPANQYEEQLVALNGLMNDNEWYFLRLSQFMSLHGSSTNPGLAKIVLYRLLTKLVDKTVSFVFSEMTEARLDVESMSNPLAVTSNKQEYVAFELHIRKLIQQYYVKGLTYGSSLWLARCACIRQRLVEGCEIGSNPSVDLMLSEEAWTEDQDGVVKLMVSSSTLRFFVLLEQTIESLICQEINVNADNVLDLIMTKTDKCEMLEIWQALTGLFFSEVESLVFMRDMVSIACNLSLRLEVNRIRDKDSLERVQKYALRTDLKRN